MNFKLWQIGIFNGRRLYYACRRAPRNKPYFASYGSTRKLQHKLQMRK